MICEFADVTYTTSECIQEKDIIFVCQSNKNYVASYRDMQEEGSVVISSICLSHYVMKCSYYPLFYYK